MTEQSHDTIEKPAGAEPVAILLLERCVDSLDLVRQALPGIRVHVLPMTDMALVPDLISREQISVVFCDQDYADPAAGRFRQQLLRVHPGLAIIQVVAAGEMDTVLEVFRQGASDVLMAPLVPAEVCHAFARVQDRAWARRDARHLQQAARTALDELVLLQSISATTSSMVDLDKLLERLTGLIQESLKVEIVSLMLADENGKLGVKPPRGSLETFSIRPVRQKITVSPVRCSPVVRRSWWMTWKQMAGSSPGSSRNVTGPAPCCRCRSPVTKKSSGS